MGGPDSFGFASLLCCALGLKNTHFSPLDHSREGPGGHSREGSGKVQKAAEDRFREGLRGQSIEVPDKLSKGGSRDHSRDVPGDQSKCCSCHRETVKVSKIICGLSVCMT